MKSSKVKIGIAAALSSLVAAPGCNDESSFEGATCYMIATEEYTDYVCSHCDNIVRGKYGSWVIRSIGQIEDLVSRMKALGYDVVLDSTEFCPYCSKKNIENPGLIFKIRFSDKADYHVVHSNIINEYQCLLEFLSDPENWKGDELKVTIVRKMTGLGEDLNIEKS